MQRLLEHNHGCHAFTSHRGTQQRVVSIQPRLASRISRVTVFAAQGAKSTAAKGFGTPKQQAGQKGIASDAPCPCGSGSLYEACCGPLHAAPASVPSPEALLRSRYTAYAAKDPAFIVETTHPESPEFTGSRTTYLRAVKSTMQRLEPRGLTILATEPGAGPDEALITFRLKRRIRDPATPKDPPENDEMTERSRFVRTNGRWLYLESSFPEDEAAGEKGGSGAKGTAAGAAAKAAPVEAPKKKGLLPFW